MENQHYLYLSSENSLDVYPYNSPGNFYCKLPQPLQLQGHWEVALLQIQYMNAYYAGTKTPRNLFVCTDICTESTLGSQKISVLKRVNNTNSAADQPIESEINHVTYVSVQQENVDVLRIYIKDDAGKLVVFSQGPLLVTLHLRRISSF